MQRFVVTILLLAGIVSATSYTVSAQAIDLEKKISVSVQNIPLYELLSIISRQGEIKFSYSNEKISADRLVSYTADEQSIAVILREICNALQMEYSIVEQQVVLKPQSAEAAKKEKKRYTINGFVKDRENGEAMIAAVVYVKEQQKGTITNTYGYYSLTLPEGRYTLQFSYLGYAVVTKAVYLSSSRLLTVELYPEQAMIEEVVVSPDQINNAVFSHQMSDMKIPPKTFIEMPAFFGESDIIKSLHTVPGIKSFGDGSAAFYVRGGDKDQNIIMTDEAKIYNPSHLFGFFSSFVPEAINDINVIKGDMPAGYGGRLSSLIEVHTRDGNMRDYHLNGSVGPITHSLALEGPVVEDKSSFFVSWRQSHIEWLFKRENPDMSLYFYDMNAKVNFRLGHKDRLYISAYRGKDDLTQLRGLEKFGINWDNSAATIRWNHVFNSRIFTNTTVFGSKYDYNFLVSDKKNQVWNSFIANTGIKNDNTFYLNPENTLRYGFLSAAHFFNPGNYIYIIQEDFLQTPEVPRRQSLENALYISNATRAGKRLSFRYGLRMPIWINYGPTTEYVFDKNHNVRDTLYYYNVQPYNYFVNLEPRMSVYYMLNGQSSLKASYNRVHQYEHLVSNSISPFNSLDVWLPSGPHIAPQRADVYAAGYFTTGKKQLEYSAEIFYKEMSNQIEYVDHASMLLNPLVESQLRFGRGWSYGLELMARKKQGRLDGWISYTFSRALRQTPGINFSLSYPAFYDRPHDMSIFASYKLSPRWSMSLIWMYASGAAITTPSGFIRYQGYTMPLYAKRNNDRLPDYHRMDASLKFSIDKNRSNNFEHALVFSVYNLYGRRNPVFVNFNKISDYRGNYVIPANRYSSPQLTQTSIHLLGIIPSITYNFRF